ncbi:uncharacterized protein LOC122791664 isoform X3 [Protopterus annectens]|uniref:uncharacterized protein LOC122791664 isoform X3 n=1 Tax=Protopterus annectens TaxID=7888 RepID=UPI001CFBE29C|nr:uncharacterized protein LOC122791664 isoform X3 [Protopterus annectens]
MGWPRNLHLLLVVSLLIFVSATSKKINAKDSCEYNGKIYENNAVFEEDCLICDCIKGVVECHQSPKCAVSLTVKKGSSNIEQVKSADLLLDKKDSSKNNNVKNAVPPAVKEAPSNDKKANLKGKSSVDTHSISKLSKYEEDSEEIWSSHEKKKGSSGSIFGNVFNSEGDRSHEDDSDSKENALSHEKKDMKKGSHGQVKKVIKTEETVVTEFHQGGNSHSKLSGFKDMDSESVSKGGSKISLKMGRGEDEDSDSDEDMSSHGKIDMKKGSKVSTKIETTVVKETHKGGNKVSLKMGRGEDEDSDSDEDMSSHGKIDMKKGSKVSTKIETTVVKETHKGGNKVSLKMGRGEDEDSDSDEDMSSHGKIDMKKGSKVSTKIETTVVKETHKGGNKVSLKMGRGEDEDSDSDEDMSSHGKSDMKKGSKVSTKIESTVVKETHKGGSKISSKMGRGEDEDSDSDEDMSSHGKNDMKKGSKVSTKIETTVVKETHKGGSKFSSKMGRDEDEDSDSDEDMSSHGKDNMKKGSKVSTKIETTVIKEIHKGSSKHGKYTSDSEEQERQSFQKGFESKKTSLGGGNVKIEKKITKIEEDDEESDSSEERHHNSKKISHGGGNVKIEKKITKIEEDDEESDSSEERHRNSKKISHGGGNVKIEKKITKIEEDDEESDSSEEWHHNSKKISHGGGNVKIEKKITKIEEDDEESDSSEERHRHSKKISHGGGNVKIKKKITKIEEDDEESDSSEERYHNSKKISHGGGNVKIEKKITKIEEDDEESDSSEERYHNSKKISHGSSKKGSDKYGGMDLDFDEPQKSQKEKEVSENKGKSGQSTVTIVDSHKSDNKDQSHLEEETSIITEDKIIAVTAQKYYEDDATCEDGNENCNQPNQLENAEPLTDSDKNKTNEKQQSLPDINDGNDIDTTPSKSVVSQFENEVQIDDQIHVPNLPDTSITKETVKQEESQTETTESSKVAEENAEDRSKDDSERSNIFDMNSKTEGSDNLNEVTEIQSSKSPDSIGSVLIEGETESQKNINSENTSEDNEEKEDTGNDTSTGDTSSQVDEANQKSDSDSTLNGNKSGSEDEEEATYDEHPLKPIVPEDDIKESSNKEDENQNTEEDSQNPTDEVEEKEEENNNPSYVSDQTKGIIINEGTKSGDESALDNASKGSGGEEREELTSSSSNSVEDNKTPSENDDTQSQPNSSLGHGEDIGDENTSNPSSDSGQTKEVTSPEEPSQNDVADNTSESTGHEESDELTSADTESVEETITPSENADDQGKPESGGEHGEDMDDENTSNPSSDSGQTKEITSPEETSQNDVADNTSESTGHEESDELTSADTESVEETITPSDNADNQDKPESGGEHGEDMNDENTSNPSSDSGQTKGIAIQEETSNNDIDDADSASEGSGHEEGDKMTSANTESVEETITHSENADNQGKLESGEEHGEDMDNENTSNPSSYSGQTEETSSQEETSNNEIDDADSDSEGSGHEEGEEMTSADTESVEETITHSENADNHGKPESSGEHGEDMDDENTSNPSSDSGQTKGIAIQEETSNNDIDDADSASEGSGHEESDEITSKDTESMEETITPSVNTNNHGKPESGEEHGEDMDDENTSNPSSDSGQTEETSSQEETSNNEIDDADSGSEGSGHEESDEITSADTEYVEDNIIPSENADNQGKPESGEEHGEDMDDENTSNPSSDSGQTEETSSQEETSNNEIDDADSGSEGSGHEEGEEMTSADTESVEDTITPSENNNIQNKPDSIGEHGNDKDEENTSNPTSDSGQTEETSSQEETSNNDIDDADSASESSGHEEGDEMNSADTESMEEIITPSVNTNNHGKPESGEEHGEDMDDENTSNPSSDSGQTEETSSQEETSNNDIDDADSASESSGHEESDEMTSADTESMEETITPSVNTNNHGKPESGEEHGEDMDDENTSNPSSDSGQTEETSSQEETSNNEIDDADSGSEGSGHEESDEMTSADTESVEDTIIPSENADNQGKPESGEEHGEDMDDENTSNPSSDSGQTEEISSQEETSNNEIDDADSASEGSGQEESDEMTSEDTESVEETITPSENTNNHGKPESGEEHGEDMDDENTSNPSSDSGQTEETSSQEETSNNDTDDADSVSESSGHEESDEMTSADTESVEDTITPSENINIQNKPDSGGKHGNDKDEENTSNPTSDSGQTEEGSNRKSTFNDDGSTSVIISDGSGTHKDEDSSTNVDSANDESESLEDDSSDRNCFFNKKHIRHGDSISFSCVTCTCYSGNMTCIKTNECPSICSVTGGQNVRTFDDSTYQLRGACSYYLVKTDSFAIYLNNKVCHKNEDFSCIDSVALHMYGQEKVEIFSDGHVDVGSEEIPLPYHFDRLFTVRRASSEVVEVATMMAFHIQYNFKDQRLYVHFHIDWMHATKGLCGTYNNNKNDDLLSSSNMIETVPEFFIESWKVNSCPNLPKHDEDTDKWIESEITCKVFDSAVLEDCHAAVDSYSYGQNCAWTVYSNSGTHGICSALANYAYRCAHAGFIVNLLKDFPDCTPECGEDTILSPQRITPQEDCRGFSDNLLYMTTPYTYVEGCICPHEMYYDSVQQKCVSRDECPCYKNNRVYVVGEKIESYSNQECFCSRNDSCSTKAVDTVVFVPELYCDHTEEYDDCSGKFQNLCELQCNDLKRTNMACPPECIPGCVCKPGYARTNEGSCIPTEECPCVYKNELYYKGESIQVECNSCICQQGKFHCTEKVCAATCTFYGDSQYILFDLEWVKFPAVSCPVLLAEQSQIEPSFKVAVNRRACPEYGDVFCRKDVFIQHGDADIFLSGSTVDVRYKNEKNITSHVTVYHSGFFTILEFENSISLYYDKHLEVSVTIPPHLKGLLNGMCGNADGSTLNEVSYGNMIQYGKNYLHSMCEDKIISSPQCDDTNMKYVESRCDLLYSEAFAVCHTEVPITPFYAACVEESSKCTEGDDCLCYCSAVAAYARTCCRKGIAVDWRTAEICPAPCEYYNRELGDGPYHFVTPNNLRLLADYMNQQVRVESYETSNALSMSFMLTDGLYKNPQSPWKLVSLESLEHPNFFVTYDENGRVALGSWESNSQFRKSATFILRKDKFYKGYIALESLANRRHFLSAANDDGSLAVTRFLNGMGVAMSFRMEEQTYGLPAFSMCTWRYESCGNPCIRTCRDPTGTICSLSVNIEGCFPHCSGDTVFDETTHRCVHYTDCSGDRVPNYPGEPSPAPDVPPKEITPAWPPVQPPVSNAPKVPQPPVENPPQEIPTKAPQPLPSTGPGEPPVYTIPHHPEEPSPPEGNPPQPAEPTTKQVIEPLETAVPPPLMPSVGPSPTKEKQVYPTLPWPGKATPTKIIPPPETGGPRWFPPGKEISPPIEWPAHSEPANTEPIEEIPPPETEPPQRNQPPKKTSPSTEWPAHSGPPPQPGCENVQCPPRKQCKHGQSVNIVPNPMNECCPFYKCECSCSSVPTCSRDERLVPVAEEDKCCPRLECKAKNDECEVAYVEKQLISGPCSAKVYAATCQGYCHSSMVWDSLGNLKNECRCCSATSLSDITYDLKCPDETVKSITIQEAASCQCNPC